MSQFFHMLVRIDLFSSFPSSKKHKNQAEIKYAGKTKLFLYSLKYNFSEAAIVQDWLRVSDIFEESLYFLKFLRSEDAKLLKYSLTKHSLECNTKPTQSSTSHLEFLGSWCFSLTSLESPVCQKRPGIADYLSGKDTEM